MADVLTYSRWMWAYAIAPLQFTDMAGNLGNHALSFFRKHGWLEVHGFYDPTNFSHLVKPYALHKDFRSTFRETMKTFWADFRDIRTLWCLTWYSCSILFTLIATMTAIGGTLSKLSSRQRVFGDPSGSRGLPFPFPW